MPEKTYRFKFKVKNAEEWTRLIVNSFPEDADLQGIKEMYAMRLEKLYNCPVECVGVEEI